MAETAQKAASLAVTQSEVQDFLFSEARHLVYKMCVADRKLAIQYKTA